MSDLSDEMLVEAARRGPADDLRVFEVLTERYQARILANCRYLTRSRDAAEDLAQEVFVKAFFALPTFEGRAQFRTWLQTLKIHHCLTFLRRSRRRTMVSLSEPGVEDEPELQVESTAESMLASGDDRGCIGRALDSMSDTLRIPLVLSDMDGLPDQEIADRLSIGLSAVKMRLKRAREQFRRLYAAADTERPVPSS